MNYSVYYNYFFKISIYERENIPGAKSKYDWYRKK